MKVSSHFVILHSLGDSLPYFVEHGFQEIEPLFDGYTNEIIEEPAQSNRPAQK